MTHTIYTNGALTAHVVDPHGGRIVGAQSMPRVTYTLRYRQPLRTPMVVGTASYEPELGYAVLPGQWALTTDIKLSDCRSLSTPPLLFEITHA